MDGFLPSSREAKTRERETTLPSVEIWGEKFGVSPPSLRLITRGWKTRRIRAPSVRILKTRPQNHHAFPLPGFDRSKIPRHKEFYFIFLDGRVINERPIRRWLWKLLKGVESVSVWNFLRGKFWMDQGRGISPFLIV